MPTHPESPRRCSGLPGQPSEADETSALSAVGGLSGSASRSLRHVARAGEGEQIAQWAGYAIRLSDEFFLPGGDREDIRQEALAGLLIAIRTFDPSKGMGFPGFAAMVVRRHLIACVKAARAVKHRFLTEATRSLVDDEGETVAIVDAFPAVALDQQEHLERLERIAKLREAVAELTQVERDALGMVVYDVPGRSAQGGSKAIDNALQRARRKLRAAA